MSTVHVQGFCPAGCGPTLVLGSDHHVICGSDTCPRPTAVADLLERFAAATRTDAWTKTPAVTR